MIIYSRDGSLVATAVIEHPVLRMQFVYPPHNYLIATVEAPGIDAKLPLDEIPKSVEFGGVVPFGIKFAPGGYDNASSLMNDEFRWVIPVAVQAHWVYIAERDVRPWGQVTLAWVLCICTYLLVFLAIVGAAFFIYRCVYPHHEDATKDHYGKISDNPHLAVPDRPPRRDQMTGQSRQYAQQLGLHGKSMMRYGSLV
jgi:hypothetical protein